MRSAGWIPGFKVDARSGTRWTRAIRRRNEPQPRPSFSGHRVSRESRGHESLFAVSCAKCCWIERAADGTVAMKLVGIGHSGMMETTSSPPALGPENTSRVRSTPVNPYQRTAKYRVVVDNTLYNVQSINMATCGMADDARVSEKSMQVESRVVS